MDRYEVMTGKMMPLTDGAHRKWGFTGKVVCVETGAVYKGISAAGRAIGRSAASVSHALKAGTCSGGYHWQYLDE